MHYLKKYHLILLTPLLFLFTISVSSCDPHRSGAVVKQGGAPRSVKYHSKPASAKRVRKNKY
ncbi:MAG: hypothetical protein COX70_07765 [Flavobacteriales bacterium CG_4_10_14_0_2_um_filter_32_8]|nr:MAG: hypothetical protein COX70_07765 [Flavobacteriales bacterium CG_4_10_14_0_2_um_filter_32_8]PJB15057.1 MAG: hypothetical protein CO118_05380 [Flavobacteriales bacterium CG_4_9_14_3_um_filter_32_8]